MDEQQYQKRADATFKRIEDLLDTVDAEDVDLERSGDVITLTFKNRGKCIINTQRPTRQIWLAAGSRAWHFDAAGEQWIDDKDKKTELCEAIVRIVKEQAGVDVAV